MERCVGCFVCFSEALALGAPGKVPWPLIWDKQPQMLQRQGGQMGNNPHSHTLGSELAWLLPSCGMTSFWREIRSASPSLG